MNENGGIRSTHAFVDDDAHAHMTMITSKQVTCSSKVGGASGTD